MAKQWTVEDFPSDAAARVTVAAFIAVVCNADPKLKERLKLLLRSQSVRAADSAERQTINAAVAWVEKLSTGGTL